MLYTHLFRPLAFAMTMRDPEVAHTWSLRALARVQPEGQTDRMLRSLCQVEDERLVQYLVGQRYENPVVLAAGYDKDCRALHGLAALGFGGIVGGGVVPEPQPGNPRPRLFRLAEDRALINRMGFPSDGALAVRDRLVGPDGHPGVPFVLNICKNTATPNGQAAIDFGLLIRTFTPHVDAFEVNVSSPNMAALRELQEPDSLRRLLRQLVSVAQVVGQEFRCAPRPLWVKLSPDNDRDMFDAIVQLCMIEGAAGLVLGNTSKSRAHLRKHPQRGELGGTSGPALRERMLQMVSRAYHLTEGKLPIAASGGIGADGDVALQAIQHGASLLHVFTALVYDGPTVARDINHQLVAAARSHRIRHIGLLRGTKRCDWKV